MATSGSKEFSCVSPEVGSVKEYFVSDNSIQIKSGEKFVNFIPVQEGIYLTEELSQGYEHAYFFIKFFSSIDPDVVAMSPTDGGYIHFQATPDLPNFGAPRWRELADGVFFTRLTDNTERHITTSMGPLKKAKLTIGGGLPTGANYFVAWIDMF